MYGKHIDSLSNFTRGVAAWFSGATAQLRLLGRALPLLAVALLAGCDPGDSVLQGIPHPGGTTLAVATQFPVVAVDGNGRAFILAAGRTNDPLLTQQRTHPFATTYEFATGRLSDRTDLATGGGIGAGNLTIATDGSGHGTALWMTSTGVLYANQFNRDVGWRGAIQLSEARDISQFRVAMDGFGRGLAVWAEGENLFARHSFFPSNPISGNPWEEVRLVRQAPGALRLGDVVYQALDGHAVWREPNSLLYASRFTGNQGWEPPLPFRDTVGNSTPPVMALHPRAPSESPIAVWEDSGRLMVAHWLPTGPGRVGWVLDQEGIPGSDGALRPHMAMAANLETVVVWDRLSGIFASRFVSGTWEPAERISSAQSVARSPRVATDATGNAIAVWGDGASVRVNRYRRGTGWEGEREIGTDRLTAPEIAMDDSGRAIVVWEAVDPDQTSESIIARVASPAITLHPSNVTISTGATATFSCFAVGSHISSPFWTHQWQRLDAGGSTWNDIAGETARGYNLFTAGPSDNGARFRCRASNGLGEAVSNDALLTVTPGGGSGRTWHPLGGALNVFPAPSTIVGAPAIEHDALGRPVVAFNEDAGIYVKRWDGSAWQQLGAGLHEGIDRAGGAPSLAIDPVSGAIYVAWEELLANGQHVVFLKQWAGNSWSLVGGAAANHNPTTSANEPAVRVRAGRPLLAWSEGGRIIVKEWTGSAWAALGPTLSPDGLSAVGTFIHTTEFVLGGAPSADRPIVAWMGGNNTGDTLVAQHASGAWSPLGGPPMLGVANDRVRLGLDATDRAIVANASTALNQFQVRRFDNGQWLPMGAALGTASGGGPFEQGVFGLAFSRTRSTPSTLVAWSQRLDNSSYAAAWGGQAWQPLGGAIHSAGRYGFGIAGDIAIADGATPTMAHVATSSNHPFVDRALYVYQFR